MELFKNNDILDKLVIQILKEKSLMFVKNEFNEGMLFDYKIDGYYSVWIKIHLFH